MFLRKLPAILALPLMAMAIVLIEIAAGKLALQDLTLGVIADGAIRLADPMVISMFGGMLSLLMQKTGVAESFVRRGAELAGDNPWVVALIMLAIISILFTTIGGLGAVIMVGTIVLPILASIGVRESISAGIVLFGISLGGILNATNWTVYRSVLSLESDVVSSYALVVFIIVALVAIGFITIELWRSRSIKLKIRSLRLGLIAMITFALVGYLGKRMVDGVDFISLRTTGRWIAGAIGTVILLYAIADVIRKRNDLTAPIARWYSYLIPVVPLYLILVFDVPFVAAFLSGLVYGVLATFRRGILNMTTRSIIEGSASVIPAIALMIGIGMLLSAILGPTKTGPGKYWHEQQANVAVANSSNDFANNAPREWPILTDMKPLLETVVPGSFLAYVLTFTLLGPLALYRGPLNVWGLGYGVGGILLATGVSPGAVMGILMSLGIIQGVSDPTNTANVWVANEVRLDVNTIMWRTLPYSWAVAFLGLIAAGLRFIL